MEWDLYPLEPILVDKVSEDNWKLRKELQAKGFFVQVVGELAAGRIDYLIVTTAPPINQALNGSIDRTSN